MFLGPRGGGPLGGESSLLDSLHQDGGTSSTRNRHDKVGQVHAAERLGLASDTRRGTVDESLFRGGGVSSP